MCDGNKVIAESKIVNNTQFSSVLKDNGSFKYKKFIDCTFNNCVFDGTNFAGASLLYLLHNKRVSSCATVYLPKLLRLHLR